MDGITIDVVEENGDEMIPDGDEDHKAILDQHCSDTVLNREGKREKNREKKEERRRFYKTKQQLIYHLSAKYLYMISKNKINR